MTARDWPDFDARHVWHPFTQAKNAPPAVPVVRGEGACLYAADGRRHIDLISSWWVNLFGHAHPEIVRAVADQAATLEQVMFAGFTHEPAARLAKELADLLPGDLNRVFFSDDGSTSVEAALKLAIQFYVNEGRPRRRILSFEGAYHGDTFGAMSAGFSEGFFAPFREHVFAVDRLPYPATWRGDTEVEAREAAALAALDRLLDAAGDDVAAIILEPLVQGAGGMRMARPAFFRAVCEKVRAAGGLVIFDEIMTGFGRTGTLFACERIGVVPDLICLSKGLTGGFLPLAVTVARDAVYEAFLGDDFTKAFTHGHSFTANPLGCAAARASLSLLQQPETRLSLARIEQAHAAALDGLAEHPMALRPRLTGTVAAVDFRVGDSGYQSAVGDRLKAFFVSRGVVIRPLGDVVYLLPPYCISDEDLAEGWAAIAAALDMVRAEAA